MSNDDGVGWFRLARLLAFAGVGFSIGQAFRYMAVNAHGLAAGCWLAAAVNLVILVIVHGVSRRHRGK